MIRKLVAVTCLALTLAACGATEPFGNGEGKGIKAAVEGLFGELERADYAGAASHWCTYEPPSSAPTADQLRATFTDYPRPWKTKVASPVYVRGSAGNVNATLVDATASEHAFNVDFTMASGTAQVCRVDAGHLSMHIEV
jgi:hypothetical protein